jgi:hypothetical protein
VLQYQRKSEVATYVAKSQAHEVAVPEARTEARTETRTVPTERDKESSVTPAFDSLSARAAAQSAAQTGPQIVSNENAPLDQPRLGTQAESHRDLAGSIASRLAGAPAQHGPRALTQQMQSQGQATQIAAANTAPAAPAVETKQQAKDDTLADKIPAASIPPSSIPATSEMVAVQAQQPALLDSNGQNQGTQLQVQSAEQSSQPSADTADELVVAKAKPTDAS